MKGTVSKQVWAHRLIQSTDSQIKLNSLIKLCDVKGECLWFLQPAASWRSLKPWGYFRRELGWKSHRSRLLPDKGTRGCVCLSKFMFSLQWLLYSNKTKSKDDILNGVLLDWCWPIQLHQRRFRLDIRIILFTEKVVKHWNCPGRWMSNCPWRCLKDT